MFFLNKIINNYLLKILFCQRQETSFQIVSLDNELDVWGYFASQAQLNRSLMLKFASVFKNKNDWVFLKIFIF